jgi:predicted CXXCH cytochrome family protein
MLVGGWLGCSARERYRVMNFFFDGVPNPDAAIAGRGGGSGAAPIVVTHKPFAEQNCNACHTGNVENALYSPASAVVSPTICLKCHQDVPHQYPVMHGPVAAVECLFCHAAHEASYPALLWKKTPDLCMQCHTRELLDPTEPAHLVADSDCLRCHFGHGGPERGLLKVARSSSPFTTAPATAPSGGLR